MPANGRHSADRFVNAMELRWRCIAYRSRPTAQASKPLRGGCVTAPTPRLKPTLWRLRTISTIRRRPSCCNCCAVPGRKDWPACRSSGARNRQQTARELRRSSCVRCWMSAEARSRPTQNQGSWNGWKTTATPIPATTATICAMNCWGDWVSAFPAIAKRWREPPATSRIMFCSRRNWRGSMRNLWIAARFRRNVCGSCPMRAR